MKKFLVIIVATASLHAENYIYGVDEDNWQYGHTDDWRGLLISPDGTEYIYSDRRAFFARTHEYTVIWWNDLHEELVYRYEMDCVRRVDNFDIDPFVTAILSGQPDECGGFVYTMDDIDPFIAIILRDW